MIFCFKKSFKIRISHIVRLPCAKIISVYNPYSVIYLFNVISSSLITEGRYIFFVFFFFTNGPCAFCFIIVLKNFKPVDKIATFSYLLYLPLTPCAHTDVHTLVYMHIAHTFLTYTYIRMCIYILCCRIFVVVVWSHVQAIVKLPQMS